MKTAILPILCCVSTLLFGQQNANRLVLECSPIMIKAESGLYFVVQGRIDYHFNKYISLGARHNQSIKGFFTSWSESLKPNPYRKSSFSELALGITLFNNAKSISETNKNIPSLSQQFVFDIGINYYRFATIQTDYYSYDMDSMGNYNVIKSINRLSSSFGFSHIIRRLNTRDPENILIKRQHLLSAGFYIGLNYDLQGFVMIPGENPSIRPTKNYSFQIGGFYARYNFRQQLTKHLFVGIDLLFTRMPYVNYMANPSIYLPRGNERERPFQSYAGITVGWSF
jgi:hypothetical protein